MAIYNEKSYQFSDVKKEETFKQPSETSNVIYDWYKSIIFALSIVAIFLSFVLRPVNVNGRSMENTLLNDDKIIISNFFYTPKVGDIIVVAHNDNLDKEIVKRVIATGGQSVKIDGETGEVFVDGILIDEPYISSSTTASSMNWEFPEVIPEGKLFVMGDNRELSADSRSSTIGLIDEKDVLGQALTIIYPFERFTFL